MHSLVGARNTDYGALQQMFFFTIWSHITPIPEPLYTLQQIYGSPSNTSNQNKPYLANCRLSHGKYSYHLYFNCPMKLIRFFAIIEKVLIVIIVLCCVPTLVYVFLPTPIQILPSAALAYQRVRTQTSLSGFLLSSNTSCTAEQTALNNDRCRNRCILGANCHILPANENCPLPHYYTASTYKFCTAYPVQNEKTNPPSFRLNPQLPPLATVSMNSNGSLTVQPYCLKDRKLCSDLVDAFGDSLQFPFTLKYQSYAQSIKFLLFFSLIPLGIHLALAVLVDHCGKCNLRIANSLMTIHLSLTATGMTVCAMLYNLSLNDLAENLKRKAGGCVMEGLPACSELMPLSDAPDNSGVSNLVTVCLGVVVALQILCLIGMVVVNALMNKYYRLREVDHSSSGYELQTL